MASEKKLIIGNWKMNLNVHDASTYLHKLDVAIQGHRDVEVVECVRRLESGMVHRFRSSFVVGAYRPVIVRAVFAETKGGRCGVF
ncbi:MAG: triosephosphate isomerase [Candidatus Saccharibacteria bacterium GW2011_GWC2_48_9]|nr:MAG: triosephosphate isomerase [Candidatus Saccharibacteria bacterium GW2011_GWC2_48_9]